MAERGLRGLLDGFRAGDPEEVLSLEMLVGGLGRRAFGMLLFIAILPAFIPIPVGGAISGPLVVLIGLQLLVGLRRPWLPKAISRRGPRRSTLVRFDDRISPWLVRLEKLVRPRLQHVLRHPLAAVYTGLLLVFLGLLLSLPIPLTNYLFGILLLLFAFAMLERDGMLMLAAWIGGTVTVAVFGVLSGEFAAIAAVGIDRLV